MVNLQRETGAGRLLATLEGPIRYALLTWALDRDIFNRCSNPVREEELSRSLNLPDRQLGLVLRALVAAGFLEQGRDGFCTASDILPFVTSGSSRNMVETLRSMSQTRLTGLDQFDALVAGSSPGGQRRLFDDAHWDASHRALSAFHQALAAEIMVTCLTGLPEWEAAADLLEVGPGSSVVSRLLLAKRPDLSITLFDLPPVAQRIEAETDGLCVRVVPGSYTQSLPEGTFDIIWCSMSLYFHDQGLPELIGRLSQRLRPGGVLVSFHEALTDQRTSPPEHVLGRLLPALRQGDVSFADGEIAGAMAAAGLVRASHSIHDTPFGRFRLDAARKDDTHA
ncbi:class I SAM-dependent methyltransferase [Pannonibacter sp. Pt2]|uniref:Class I SAM-dependent methyltransferase n=1 Tax=Pannonibacter anstelovis TaxID=3121537 RepID=A0ABU7ZRZ0_9HYPH